MLLDAGGAERMTEISFGALSYIGLGLVPESLVVPDLFAEGANGDDPPQRPDFCQSEL